MKLLKLAALAGLSLSASAIAAEAPTTETGLEPGRLAVAAIERGDYARAETLLTDNRMNAEDPARLINLGEVYWRTGRQGQALSTWRRALASPNHYQVETMGGRALSTADLAREALSAHDTAMRSASR